MRRVGRARATGDSVDATPGLRRAGVTFGIALACALGAPAAATAATTIHVTETKESATFRDSGNHIPAGYNDSIAQISNDNGECSLREAIAASNTDRKVDGCPAGDGPGDVVELPAGEYDLYDNLIVTQRVVVRGANAGRPGNDPGRGPETTIKLVNHPNSHPQPALFWLGAPSPSGPAEGGGSEFNGLTLEGNKNPLCVEAGKPVAECEEWAIVQPEKSGGTNTAPGLKLRNSIIRNFTAGVYLGGERAVIARNLFKDNQALFVPFETPAGGVDVYSDAVYTNINPVVVGNVFANPRTAAVELQGVGITNPEPVFGGLIRNNLVNLKNGEPFFAILLLDTHGQRIQDNVIRDPSPPALQERCCTDGIHLDGVNDVDINGNTITGLAAALRVSDVLGGTTGVHDVRATHNRFYDNAHGIRVFDRNYPAGSIDARFNWWGANGGEGSDGARPGAVNPVNDLWFGHIEFLPGGGFELVQDPPPVPNWINTADPLQLGCSMPAHVTVNTPVQLTGSVPGMPSVNRSASKSPWFESVHTPLMAAGVSGVPGTTSGFDQPPSTGVFGGHVIPGGGSLIGVLMATAAGAGAGTVALDSEQVACPFQAAPGPQPDIGKDPDSPTVTAGGLAGYRITVTNRSNVTARNWWVCDRPPRGMTFVRATRDLRRLGRLRCLVIPRLRPHQHVSFHLTFRVAANASSATTTNIAEVIPGLPAGGRGTAGGVTPPPARVPIDKTRATVTVRHPAPRPPAPPPVTG